MAPVYVLDACVLYPVVLRDLLLTLGALDALEPRWTESILDEMTRNVLADMFWSIDPAAPRRGRPYEPSSNVGMSRNRPNP